MAAVELKQFKRTVTVVTVVSVPHAMTVVSELLAITLASVVATAYAVKKLLTIAIILY